MAAIGYDRIAGLLQGTEPPMSLQEADAEAVGLLQEIIRCHGYRKVPGRKNHTQPAVPGGDTFGTYGTLTGRAVDAFKDKYNLAHPKSKLPAGTAKTTVDRETLNALISWRANQSTPGAGRVFLVQVLGLSFTVWEKMAALISTHEESANGGGFTAVSPKSQTWWDVNHDNVCDGGPCDEAGLSYGISQSTHESGRLFSLLHNMRTARTALFDQTFRVPGTTIAGLFDHLNNFTAQTSHGIATGATYDLYSSRWRTRFEAAGRISEFQRIQIDTAVTSLRASYRLMKVTNGGYATDLKDERGIGFWLDLTNQTGDARAKTRYTEVVQALHDQGKPVNQTTIINEIVKHSKFVDRRKYFRDFAPLNDPTDPFANA
ncbi:MAG: hypothetical protein RLZZ326_616 [Planctomycetota bacterium]|jgi:hypothetical protein